jgi:hypothetical protein
LEERLIHPHDSKHAGLVARQHFEQAEPTTACATQSGADHFATDGSRFTGHEVGGSAKPASIFEPDRKAMQEVVCSPQPSALELGGSARTNTP